MINFKESVNKTTIYTSQECNTPNIGEHIIIPNNQKEYKVIGIIGMVNSLDKTIVVTPLSASSISYKDYLSS